MCGRYSRSCETQAVVEAFGVDEVATDILPSYNIGPGQDIAVIACSGKRRLGTLRWGLKPAFGSRAVINARAETLARRPMFKGLLERRRCLIPAEVMACHTVSDLVNSMRNRGPEVVARAR